jgi:hypothetical protein
MEIYAVSGKGGVGKTTVSASLALDFANNGKKTLLIDCDKKGKAITRTFSPEGKISIPTEYGAYFPIGNGKLVGGAIRDYSFESLPRASSTEAESSNLPREAQFRKYLAQFQGEYGIGAYQDMMSTFFGVNSNPDQSLEFVMLSQLILGAKSQGIEKIVLDLEPTKGTARLLNNVKNAAQTLRNMSEYGFVTLKMISAKFPDVTRFLESEYIQNAELYGNRMMEVARRIAGARCVLVCGPEAAKVDEMFEDTEQTILSFKGKIGGYVVNDIRPYSGAEEESQKRQIERVEREGVSKVIPVIMVNHNPEICMDNTKDSERRKVLSGIGRDLTLKLAAT